MLACIKFEQKPPLTMNIGKLQLANNLILAPMAGITDLPYRRLMKRFGAGLVFSEMVSANGLLHAGRKTRELLRSHAEERPLGVQLFGSDPDILGRTARMVEEDGELLDLNLGCPVNKVVRSGAGSALLRDPARVGRMVAAVRKSVQIPLTVKIRSGWDASSVNFLEVARIAVEEGADGVALHPRTRAQGFSGHSDWDHIRLLREALPPTVPVIGSGDIFCAADALSMLERTGCDAVMIGRGGYGNPWLLREILAAQQGSPIHPPTLEERRAAIDLHLELFLETFNPAKAAREMRKHLCWYSRGLPGAAAYRAAVNQARNLEELCVPLDALFSSAAEENKETA